MDFIAQEVQSALRLAIDAQARIEQREVPEGLSPHQASSFTFYDASLLGESLILARPFKRVKTVEGLVAQLGHLAEALGTRPTLLLQDLSPVVQRELIRNRIPFICTNGNLYLPESEILSTAPQQQSVVFQQQFTPAEQLVFLHLLYGGDTITQQVMQERSGLSPATVSRVLSGFVERGLIHYELAGKTNRTRVYHPGDKGILYASGMKFFGDVVYSRVECSDLPEGMSLPVCGESSLAAQSNLLEPQRITYAATTKQFKRVVEFASNSTELPSLEVIEFRYDPQSLVSDGHVDPVSTLKTLDGDDERIRLAIREMMGEYSWFTG